MLAGRARVGIVGAGPAGLLLAHLLRRAGIDSVVLEKHSREHIERRVRAGVLEQGTVELLRTLGLGERMQREGMVHRGIELRFEGRRHHIDFEALTGRTITVYGQQEIVKDLVKTYLAEGGALFFEVESLGVFDLDGDRPRIRYVAHGEARELECEIVAGCDGSHGVSRHSVPEGVFSVFERRYPFAWLGVLAEAPPFQPELVYAHHERGLALFSMRSPSITRLYLQVDAAETSLAGWSDERIWQELHTRLQDDGGRRLEEGPILERSLTQLRSLVTEPMQYGRLFLVGDAAHIVPPTGAKGLNLAVADACVLARALVRYFDTGERAELDRYSETCLRRVWRAESFSGWMTSLLHRFPDHDAFQRRLQIAQLEYVTRSRAAAASLSENYVGLPLDWPEGAH